MPEVLDVLGYSQIGRVPKALNITTNGSSDLHVISSGSYNRCR